MKRTPSWAATALGVLLLAIISTPAQDTFQFQWQESGISKIMLGYRPLPVAWSTNAPAAGALPAGLKAPRHGSFTFGTGAKAPRFAVAVDYADGHPARLFVDENSDGSIADDRGHDWTTTSYKNPSTGKTSTSWSWASIKAWPGSCVASS